MSGRRQELVLRLDKSSRGINIVRLLGRAELAAEVDKALEPESQPAPLVFSVILIGELPLEYFVVLCVVGDVATVVATAAVVPMAVAHARDYQNRVASGQPGLLVARVFILDQTPHERFFLPFDPGTSTWGGGSST